MGNWTRVYVDEAMNGTRREGFDRIFPIAFAGIKKLMQSIEYAPLTVARTADTVRFSVPESTVEIVMMRGLNDQPITIDGLPSPC